jgi:membrane associated rhomboid family serine protease
MRRIASDCPEAAVPSIPPVTLKLLWTLTGAFVIQLLAGDFVVRWLALWPIGAESMGGAAFLPWQLVTYPLVHDGFVHLFFGALILWMLGSRLENQWGPKRYTHFILACVLAAGMVHLLFTAIGAFPTMAAVGFSGATYGFLLAYGMMYPNQQLMLVIPPVPIKAKYLVMIIAGLSVFMGLTSPGGVAHFAHLGGMLGAWLVMRYWRGDPPFGKRRPTLRSVR